MNPQPGGYATPYPPPTQAYSYQFPYPQQQVGPQHQQVPPYNYHPQAPPHGAATAQQHLQASQSNPYVQSFQTTPQPRSSRTPVQPQQNGRRQPSTSSTPHNDPSAPAPEPTSPEIDSFDQDLMNALQDNNPAEAGQEQEEQDNEDEPEPDAHDDDGPVYHLPPPPEETYPNEAELDKAMHAWSLEHGYELVRRAAKKNAAGEMYKRYYHCSKHGQKSGRPAPQVRKRANRRSNRIGCPMSLASVARDPSNPGGEWQIRHRKTYHNHPANDPNSLAGHRRRAREGGVEKAVDQLFSIGNTTAQVLKFLQGMEGQGGLFTRTDVANMKLKWRKYGTCTFKPREEDQVQSGPRGGPAWACYACRAKKTGCSGERPVCSMCRERGGDCKYEKEGEGTTVEAQPRAGTAAEPMDLTTDTPTRPAAGPRRSGIRAQQAAQTREILAELKGFQAVEHVTHDRLSLQSSSVETLAQGACGSGESYERLPVLTRTTDWPQFRDAVISAAMKENTYEVLIGAKIEPQRPAPDAEQSKLDEIKVWNEYIKQLAIYNRRNTSLLTALRDHMATNLRSRVQSYVHASLIWQALEDLCQPRGSETAWKLYTDIHDISLANSSDLKDYIHRITSTYAQFKKLKLNTSPLPSHFRPRGETTANIPTAEKGEDALPEEMICFLFLRNLGASWRHWVDGLVATNNIGGFGTGDRLGLNELCKRAEAYEAMQRRELGR